MYLMWRDKLERAIEVVGPDVDIEVHKDHIVLVSRAGHRCSVPLLEDADVQCAQQRYPNVHFGTLRGIPRGMPEAVQLVALRERPHDCGLALEMEVHAIYRYDIMDERIKE